MAKFKYPKEMFKVPGFMKEISTNKYVLYIVAFFALTNILGYIMLNKNICVLLFVLIAYVMTYFTSNMVFVLVVPIFVVGFFSICKGTAEIVERYANMMEISVGDDVVTKSGDMTGTIEKKEDGNITIRISPTEGVEDVEGAEEMITLDEAAFMKKWKASSDDDKNDMADTQDILDNELDSMGDAQEGSASKKKKKTKSSSKKPSSNMQDNVVDPLKSEIAAMTTMQDGLGSQGMAGLAGDTQSLIKNQQALMDAMKGMGPMLQQAKGMLDSLDIGGLGSAISAITGGNGGKKESFGSMKASPLGFSAY